MITLASECLLFELAGGQSIPYSADMIAVELTGDSAQQFDPDFVKQATNAVFHYFKHELGQQTITVGEFAGALEKVLRTFQLHATPMAMPASARLGVIESDLARLADETGSGCELFFFNRLRDELRQQLQQAPKLVRFRGLRGCVKRLSGTRRWCPRCRTLHAQIIDFLRACLSAEPASNACALLVE
jgi:hypothetical protein